MTSCGPVYTIYGGAARLSPVVAVLNTGAASYTSSAGTPGRYYYDGRVLSVACDAVQLARYLRSRVQDAAGQAPPPLQLLQTVSDKGHYRTQQSTITANPQDRCSVAPI